ncbi:unnamed protein product [Angiostrongylus costaricensis]|uniref:Uncharacterized protein n=1 Tax=Angiostrongylus costaricensis TaxID=334426 RepID=A0A0R3PL67_ANGCS|nr:unnamed protein product [Angiostrongylus costaricensis]
MYNDGVQKMLVTCASSKQYTLRRPKIRVALAERKAESTVGVVSDRHSSEPPSPPLESMKALSRRTVFDHFTVLTTL